MKEYRSPEIVRLGAIKVLTEGSSEPNVDALGPPFYHNAHPTVRTKKATAKRPTKAPSKKTKAGSRKK